jgi:hypothetical protein
MREALGAQGALSDLTVQGLGGGASIGEPEGAITSISAASSERSPDPVGAASADCAASEIREKPAVIE